MIKKLSSLVLVLFIAFSLTACGDKGSDVVNETANSLLEELDNGSLEADTDEVLTGEWFGWVRESDCWGDHSEDFQTALGYVGYDDAGNKYFEVYKDDGSETAFISMFIEDENTDTRIIPVIGEEDAWIGDTYLLEEEGQYLETAIDYDGSLYLVHSYTSYDESSGCVVEMFLRKDEYAKCIKENTVDDDSGLKYDVQIPFRQDDFLTKWSELYRATSTQNRSIIDVTTFCPEKYTKELLVQLIMKTLNGELSTLKAGENLELTLRNIIGDWYNIKYIVKMGNDSIDIKSVRFAEEGTIFPFRPDQLFC